MIIRKMHGVLLAAASLLSACDNSGEDRMNTPLAASVTPKTVIVPGSRTLCFEAVSGNRNQDTLQVQLRFHGDQVSGTMTRRIYEKDTRTGTLSGLLLQPDIRAVWTFMQEGVTDTMAVDFRLGDDELWQKPIKGDPGSGRPVTDEDAAYSERIPLVDCK